MAFKNYSREEQRRIRTMYQSDCVYVVSKYGLSRADEIEDEEDYVVHADVIDENGNVNCVGCSTCTGCVGCIDCLHCSNCEVCYMCNHCDNCTYLDRCKQCRTCDECTNCTFCGLCTLCNDCHFCGGVRKGWSCTRCTACSHITAKKNQSYLLLQ